MNPWLQCWIGSSIVALIVFKSMRAIGLSFAVSTTISVLCFPTPLLTLMNSGNSVLYPFDLAIIYVAYIFLKYNYRFRFNEFPSTLILISAGLWPFIGSFLYAEGQTDIFINLINLYRLIGILMLAEIVSKQNLSINFNVILKMILTLTFIYSVLIYLQFSGILSLNLYEIINNTDNADREISELNEIADTRFIILGYFKAQQGILFMMFFIFGFVSFGIKEGINGKKIFLGLNNNIIGILLCLLAGIGLILTGSKTTIFAILFVSLLGFLISSDKIKSLIPFLIFFIIILTLLYFVSIGSEVDTVINSTLLNFINSGGSDVETLDSRRLKIDESMLLILSHPNILLGIYDQIMPDYNISYFHNEYLSVLMLGGGISFIMYLYSIFHIYIKLNLKRKNGLFSQAIFLIFIGNLIQGYTVAHFQPSIFFIESAGLSILFYRMVIANG